MSQPKALFLADVIKADPASKTHHDEAAAELRRLHAVNAELLEALKNLEKEFRKVYPIYYYAEPWGHKTNVPLQAARAAIDTALKEKNNG